MALSISEKLDVKEKSVTGEKRGHFIMIKSPCIMKTNVYAPNNRNSKDEAKMDRTQV